MQYVGCNQRYLRIPDGGPGPNPHPAPRSDHDWEDNPLQSRVHPRYGIFFTIMRGSEGLLGRRYQKVLRDTRGAMIVHDCGLEAL